MKDWIKKYNQWSNDHKLQDWAIKLVIGYLLIEVIKTVYDSVKGLDYQPAITWLYNTEIKIRVIYLIPLLILIPGLSLIYRRFKRKQLITNKVSVPSEEPVTKTKNTNFDHIGESSEGLTLVAKTIPVENLKDLDPEEHPRQKWLFLNKELLWMDLWHKNQNGENVQNLQVEHAERIYKSNLNNRSSLKYFVRDDSIYKFLDGKLYRKDLLFGFLGNNNKTKIPLIFDYAEPFCDGRALVERYGKFGYINKSGKEIIPIEWDAAESFSKSEQGYAEVRKDGKRYRIDVNGEIVHEIK